MPEIMLRGPASRPLLMRDALADDAPALAALKLATFRETFLEGFKIPYPPDDLALFEEETYSVAKVSAELADPAHRTWVVEDGPRLVAYAHIGPCKLPHPEVEPGATEIYQLYLLGEMHGAGLGGQMLDHVLAEIGPSETPVWLGVWSGNDRAQRLYASRGFARVGGYGFRVGSWLDDEYILRRP
jgi:ribosomal protein S18 acetylase RimI-like enzyme